MSGFSNLFRATQNRTLEKKRMIGVVVDVDDPEKQQRIRVRSHYLHKDIPDDKLPWMSPSSLTTSNASGGAGTHGPIPMKGSKVWFQFNDDTQYHGEYIGGVNTKDTKLDDFTKAGSKWAANYGHAYGGVDGSGHFSGTDNKNDRREETHVSGTGHSVDGKGNLQVNINGDADTGNKDAAKDFAKGGTVNVNGDLTLVVSGNITLSAKGTLKIIAAGELDLSSSSTIKLAAGQSILLVAPSIKSSTPITLGAAGAPDSPMNVPAITPRKRPEIKTTDNDLRY